MRFQTMVQQRVYGLCLGYEDLNDQDELKTDIAHQTAMDTDQPLASSPTLCRFESSITRDVAMAISELLIDLFIESYHYPPEILILDLDATDDPIHGHQEGRFFHGYYDLLLLSAPVCFLWSPVAVCLLRPSNIDASKYAGANLL